MAANKYKLTWTTVINGTQKVAKTHFGVKYTVTKDGNAHNWIATVTVPRHSGIGPQTVELASGVSFARAKAACQDDATRSGGR